MDPIYRICVFGNIVHFGPEIRRSLVQQFGEFGLKFDREVELQFGTAHPFTGDSIATVGLFFGDAPIPQYTKPPALQNHHPVIPIVSRITRCGKELPKEVVQINAMERADPNRDAAIASAALESLGLVPARRRIFLSYRRIESRNVALQLYDDLCARQFDVFLDTHEIRPGAIFQDALWHQMCDSDVMLMLDTKGYFESQWTQKEFGRANSHKTSILRIGYPGVTLDKSYSVTESINLTYCSFNLRRRFKASTLDKIADGVERLRSKSVAVRQADLFGSFRTAVTSLGGTVSGPGPHRRLEARFPNKKTIMVYPIIGVPTSEQVHKAATDAKKNEFAIIYNTLGVLMSWQKHLEWLEIQVDDFRWIKSDGSDGALKDFAK